METEVDKIAAMMASFNQACRQAGLKITHQRLEIYRELAAASDHPSAETIYHRVSKRLPTISLDTVYRTLATLEKQGMIIRLQTMESQARFEAKLTPHHHAVCRSCGVITDFAWNNFDQLPVPGELAEWGDVRRHNAVLEGICRTCQTKPAEQTGNKRAC